MPDPPSVAWQENQAPGNRPGPSPLSAPNESNIFCGFKPSVKWTLGWNQTEIYEVIVALAGRPERHPG